MTKDWIRLAGRYESAVNAVRLSDHDRQVTDEEYGELVSKREAS